MCELMPLFDIAQPTLSHHLKKLRDAGLVDVERRGQWAYYYVNPGALDPLAAWLEQSAFGRRRRRTPKRSARSTTTGIAGRQATFETSPRTAADVLAWFADGLPLLVAGGR